MNNNIKGILYEKQVKDLIINNLGKSAYLWNECPENILINNNLISSHNHMRLLRKNIKEGYLHNHKDIGIDIIQINGNDNDISLIQCKNGYKKGLCIDDLGGIMMQSALSKLATCIYYTECLSRNVLNISQISPYTININCCDNFDKLIEYNSNILNDNKIYFIKLPFQENQKIDKINQNIIPYEYQIDAYNKFKKNYEKNNRGILSIPCGCGKTYNSKMISDDFKQIVILSPLREFAIQNLNRYIEYGYNNKYLLVDSDGNRNIDYIKEFIKNNENLLISCTYNSMDIISKCLELFTDALFIIDEFHNLSKANISDVNNDIYKLLISNHNILFMSATPRIYDIENDDDNFIDNDYLFGDIIYKMSFTNAIQNKNITDYIIWLPSIHENNEELDKELSIYEIDNDLKNRCKFLYSCILNNGSNKCIIYCKDTSDMKNMINCMKSLNEFYIIDFEINSICCKNSEKERKNILEKFSNNNEKKQLLFNIMILNECIDIPKCDSIYISYPPKNKITTIQRINRATRIDINNPFKIANIYIWCEEYEEILETLSSIKEYDIMFKDKIKINILNFYNNKDEKILNIINNDKKILDNYIIDIKEFKQYSWKEKLELLKEYIKEYKKPPSTHDKNKEVKSLAIWIGTQKENYKGNKNNMLNEEIRKEWEEFIETYKDYFKSNEEIWRDNLNEIINYIKEYKKPPPESDKNREVKLLGNWLSKQKQNYKGNKNNMLNEEIRKEWEEFNETYKEYFKSNEEIWRDKLNEIINYIKEYKKPPSRYDKNREVKLLGNWLSKQKQNYKNNKEIMSNEEIKKEWEEFIETYKEYF